MSKQATFTAFVTITEGRKVFTEVDFTYNEGDGEIHSYVTTKTFGSPVAYPRIEGKFSTKAEFKAAVDKVFSRWQPRFKVQNLCFTAAELDAIED